LRGVIYRPLAGKLFDYFIAVNEVLHIYLTA
jgi:hypothetical protein